MQSAEQLELHLQEARGAHRIDPLIALVGHVSKSDPVRARALAEEAFSLAAHEGDAVRMGRAHAAHAVIEMDLGDPMGAVRRFLEAKRLFEAERCTEGLADLHRNLMLAYSMGGSHEEANEAYREARRLHEAKADPVRMALLENNAGILEANRGAGPAAADHFRRALMLAAEHGIDHVAQSAANNLGGLGVKSGAYEQGLAFASIALDASHRLGTRRGGAAALVISGQCLAGLGRKSEAQARLREGLAIAEELGMSRIAEEAHGTLESLARSTGEFQAAADHARDVAALRGDLIRSLMDATVSRAKADDDALRAEQRLQAAQRMEALANLAAGAAHDLNNIVAAILGHAAIGREASDEKARHEAFEEVTQAAEQGADLARQLLEFARTPNGQPEHADVNQAVERVLRLLHTVLPSRIRMETVLAAHLPTVRMQSGRLEQVLMNLIVNARDAIPGSGTLTIRTAARGQDEVELTVRDTGTGMDEETQHRLFEPLFTTKAEGDGTGLGLFTSRNMVEACGGGITFTSTPGEGTTFSVVLPADGETKGTRPA